MTAVIRIKRRRGEDPAEALLLSCKRLRQSNGAEPGTEIESVLSFAGTMSSKLEPVSSHIKEAIKKRKLTRQIHPSSSHLKNTVNRSSLTSRIRSQNALASEQSRYRVLSSKRALDLAELDGGLDTDTRSSHKDDKYTSSNCPVTQTQCTVINELTEPHASASSKAESSSSSTQGPPVTTAEIVPSPPLSVQTLASPENRTIQGDGSAEVISKKEFCLFDVEEEGECADPFFGVSQDVASSITVNDRPMVCRKAEAELTDDSQFVYDLYFTQGWMPDVDLHSALTVETLCHVGNLTEQEENEEALFVHEDSDDSNDENNWRNDYPDEDPHFFENEDYDYAEDMVDTGYLNDDESDLLAYWMGSRCNVESRSDDDEDEYEDDESIPLDV